MVQRPMKITVYHYVKENISILKPVEKAGLISFLLERDLELYEDFHRIAKETGSKMQAASEVGEKYKISECQVFRVVKRLGQQI